MSVEEVEEHLERLVKEHFDAEKAGEVGRRLEGVVAGWRSGAVEGRCRVLVGRVVGALVRGEVREAEATFTTLSCDYGGQGGNAQVGEAVEKLPDHTILFPPKI